MNLFLTAALHYADLGYSVIPMVKGGKRPQIDWKEFQKRKATKEEITEWWTKWPDCNVGIVTGAISNLDVVDLDMYKENYARDVEQAHFPPEYLTPVAISPRGGNHIYILHDPALPGKADIFPGIDIRGEGNCITAPPSVNGSGKPYSWLEGYSLDSIPLAPVPASFREAVLALYNNKNNIIIYRDDNNPLPTEEQQDQHLPTTTTSDTGYYKEGRRNEDMFTLAYALARTGCSPGFIKESLMNMAKNCLPPYDEKETVIVITSAIDRAKNRIRNLTEEIREWVMTTSGEFLTTDVYKEFDLTTRDKKKHAAVILGRLLSDKIIEKAGKKKGHYRLVDLESPIIDHSHATRDSFPIEFPLGVEQYVLIHPSNIIILAGESNAGKTGFCLATCQKNRNKGYAINYLSCEMQDGTELGIRLDEFGDVKWDGVEFRYRAENFSDVIMPDALNVIDYLEEIEEPWKMTQRIKEIQKKLSRGVALICIQKNSKKQFGFGGEGTKNAARLYMTITGQNRLTIEKGKIWRSKLINPNGAYCDFKLVSGCNFIKTGNGWNY